MCLQRADVHDHQSLGIATHVVLEEVGQLGVAVRDVRVLAEASTDDISQASQALVDGCHLLEAFTFDLARISPLTAGQVY